MGFEEISINWKKVFLKKSRKNFNDFPKLFGKVFTQQNFPIINSQKTGKRKPLIQ
jgi:hypothetical protein